MCVVANDDPFDQVPPPPAVIRGKHPAAEDIVGGGILHSDDPLDLDDFWDQVPPPPVVAGHRVPAETVEDSTEKTVEDSLLFGRVAPEEDELRRILRELEERKSRSY